MCWCDLPGDRLESGKQSIEWACVLDKTVVYEEERLIAAWEFAANWTVRQRLM
jgi:hypothetical protein